jgi:hypothetical protein
MEITKSRRLAVCSVGPANKSRSGLGGNDFSFNFLLLMFLIFLFLALKPSGSREFTLIPTSERQKLNREATQTPRTHSASGFKQMSSRLPPQIVSISGICFLGAPMFSSQAYFSSLVSLGLRLHQTLTMGFLTSPHPNSKPQAHASEPPTCNIHSATIHGLACLVL